ncbi:MAG: hypothetical protein L6U16_12635 [Porphyromonadaceae bacterium]|nr:MAG: hypothetical protein L6U16_12635 [Porphyromonadaceae bacterium]
MAKATNIVFPHNIHNLPQIYIFFSKLRPTFSSDIPLHNKKIVFLLAVDGKSYTDLKKSQQVNESTGQRVIGYRGWIKK